jgi:hypothetical protein
MIPAKEGDLDIVAAHAFVPFHIVKFITQRSAPDRPARAPAYVREPNP